MAGDDKSGSGLDPTDSEDWRNMPLFADVMDERNPQMQALLELAKEEKPEVLAENLKNSGNKAYGLGKSRYDDAITYYTQAIEQKSNDKKLNGTIYCNRAQTHLKMKNYGKCIEDCKLAIENDALLHKAYFRGSMANKYLKKYEECIKWLEKGILMLNESKEENNETIMEFEKELKNCQLLVANKLEKEEKLKQEKLAKEKIKNEKEWQLQDAMSKRKIIVGNDIYNTESNYSNQFKFDCKQNIIYFNVLFIYPEFGQSDFVRQFCESTSMKQQLNQMFPPNGQRPTWDKDAKYTINRLSIFCQTRNQLLSININSQLGHIVKRNDYVMPRIPVFYVVCKDSPFLINFLKKKSQQLLS